MTVSDDEPCKQHLFQAVVSAIATALDGLLITSEEQTTTNERANQPTNGTHIRSQQVSSSPASGTGGLMMITRPNKSATLSSHAKTLSSSGVRGNSSAIVKDLEGGFGPVGMGGDSTSAGSRDGWSTIAPSFMSGRVRWWLMLLCITCCCLLPRPVAGTCPFESTSLTVWTGPSTNCSYLYQLLLTPDGRRMGLCQSLTVNFGIFQLNTTMTPILIFPSLVGFGSSSTTGCVVAMEIGWAAEISALLIRCSASQDYSHQFILAIPMNDTSSYRQTSPVIRTTANLDVCAPSTSRDGKFYLTNNYVGPDNGSPFGYLLWNCGLDLVALSLSSSQLIPISTCPGLFISAKPLLYVSEFSLVIHQCNGRIYQITLSTFNISQTPIIDYYDTSVSFNGLLYDPRYQEPLLFAATVETGDIILLNLTDHSSNVIVSQSNCIGYIGMSLDMTRNNQSPGVLLLCTQQTNTLVAVHVESGLGTVQPILTSDQCVPFYVAMPSDGRSLDLMCNVGYGWYFTGVFVAETISGTTTTLLGPSCSPFQILYDPIHDETFEVCSNPPQLNLLRNGIITPLISLGECSLNTIKNVVLDPTNHLLYVVCTQGTGGIMVLDLNQPKFPVTTILQDTTCQFIVNVYLQPREASDGLGTATLLVAGGLSSTNDELTHIVVNGTHPVDTPLTPILQNSCVNPSSIFQHTQLGILYVLCTNHIIGLKHDGSEVLIDMTNFICPTPRLLIEDLTDPTRLLLMCNQALATITGDLMNGLSITITSTGTTLCLSYRSSAPQQDPVSGLFFVVDCHALVQTFSISPLGQVVFRNSLTNNYCPNNAVFDYKVDASGTIRQACMTGEIIIISSQFRCMDGYYWSSGRCYICPSGTARLAGVNSTLNTFTAWGCNPCAPGTIAPLKGQSLCLNCQPGFFTKDYGSTFCLPCFNGEEQPANGQTTCTPCQPGFYANEPGTSNCHPCPLGTASSFNGTTQCLPCYPGSHANITGLTECQRAEPGSVVLGVGAHYSVECEPGTFTNSSGLSYCTSCSLGYEQPKSGQTGCTPCQPGFYADAPGTPTCHPCTLGTASSEEGTVVCSPCYPGSYSNSTGLTHCYSSEPGSEVRGIGAPNSTLCSPGSYSSSSGTIICSLCAIGRYQPTFGSTSCIPAESGYMVDLPGSTFQTLCLAGTISDSSIESSSCRPCARGTYTDQDGQFACQDCEVGKFASALGSHGCQECAPGSFASKNQTIYCIPCTPGSASSFTGLTSPCAPCSPGEAQSMEGQELCTACLPPYYSPNFGSSICTHCPYSVSLDRTSCGLNPCPNNYVYIDTDGVGCTLCPLGEYSNNATIGGCINCLLGFYTPQRGLDCTSCSQSADQEGLICVGGLASVKTDYFAYLTDPDPITGIQLYATEPCPVGFCPGGPLQLSTDTILGNSSSSNTSSSSIIYCQFPRLNSADNLLCAQCVDGYLPWASKCVSCTEVNSGLFFGGFILSLSLVIFLLRSGGSAAGPLAVFLYFIQTAALEIGSVSQWLNWLHIVNFGTESTSACLAPWSPIEQMIFSICIPLILLSEVLVLAFGHKVLAYYYSRTAVSSEPESSTTITRSLSVFSSGYSSDRYICGAMSVLLFTYTQVTVTCFKYLYCIDIGSHHRLVFTAPTIDCHSSAYRSGLGLVGFTIAVYVIGFPVGVLIFLYRYRHQHLSPLTHHHSSPPIVSSPSTVSEPPSSSLSEYSLDVHTAEQASPSTTVQLSPFALRYGSLYLMFGSHAWFYQPFILLRRASFVLISVLLVQDSSSRFLGFGLGNFASLLIHLYLRPFSRSDMNQLETSSYILLILVSMVLAAYQPPYTLSIQIFVFLAIIPFAIVMIICVFNQQIKQLKQQLIEYNQRKEATQPMDAVQNPVTQQQRTIEPPMELQPNPSLSLSNSIAPDDVELVTYDHDLNHRFQSSFHTSDPHLLRLNSNGDGQEIDSESSQL